MANQWLWTVFVVENVCSHRDLAQISHLGVARFSLNHFPHCLVSRRFSLRPWMVCSSVCCISAHVARLCHVGRERCDWNDGWKGNCGRKRCDWNGVLKGNCGRERENVDALSDSGMDNPWTDRPSETFSVDGHPKRGRQWGSWN